jgi:hypothetical protein
MKTLAKILVTLILICSIAVGGIYYYLFLSGDKTPLQQLVPNDTLTYADVKETRKLAIEIATSGQAAAFTELGKLMGAVFALALGEIDEDEGPAFSEMPTLDWNALLEAATHFNRQIATFTLESEIESLPFHGYAIAHFQGDPEEFKTAIQAFIDSVHRELRANEPEAAPFIVQTTTIAEHAINSISLPQATKGLAVAWEINPCWAVTDGRCVFGLNPDSLAKYLDTLKTITPETSLEQNPNFALAAEHQSQMDGQGYINAGSLIEAIAVFANESFGAKVSQAGISIDNAIDAMGLLEIETIFYAYDFDAISSTMTQGFTYREPKGMLSLYQHNDPLSPPTFIPSNSYSASSAAVDIGEMLILVKDIVLQAAPQMAIMYPNYKQIADQQLGQDVERFLRDTFSSEFHTFSSMNLSPSDKSPYSDLSQSQTYVFGLTDVEGFTRLIDEKLTPFRELGILPLVEEDVAGFSTFVFNNAENPQVSSFGYSIAADKLFIGYGMGDSALDAFRQSLALLASNETGAIQSPKASELYSNNAENLIAISLVDIEILLESVSEFVERFKASADQAEDAAVIEVLNQINWEALETLKIKIATVGTKEDHLILTKLNTFSE